jgi:DNA repair photolyase
MTDPQSTFPQLEGGARGEHRIIRVVSPASRDLRPPEERRRLRSRGAPSQPAGRFEKQAREPWDDGWPPDDAPVARLDTRIVEERAQRILSTNDSPDIPFEASVNPYRGCEHGCIYCYARPSHAYLELSPGLDFESRLFAKTNAVERLRATLAGRTYRPSPIALGSNTDCYQPIERHYRITRGLLELLAACEHPFTIVTKSALVERDLDLIAPMAAKNMARVYVSITTLDPALARVMEPRAASPLRRVETVRRLGSAGVPTGVMVSPIIPALNDAALESVIEAAADAGAISASYLLLRLPNELKQLFREWLATHFPDRADHVMSVVRQIRGGRDNDPRFGFRMRGEGQFASLIAHRFANACRRFGLNCAKSGDPSRRQLDCSRFRPPATPIDAGTTCQADLFD